MVRLQPWAGTALVAVLLAGCTIVSYDEDRAVRERSGPGFSGARYVEAIWSRNVLPQARARAAPLDKVAADPTAMAARYGNRPGRGSPASLFVVGEGVVQAIDRASQRGSLLLAVPHSSMPVRLQLGPVIAGTAIRDALPSVAFDDFADQLAYADVGNAMTAKAGAATAASLAGARVGQRLRVLAAGTIGRPGEPLLLVPISVEVRS